MSGPSPFAAYIAKNITPALSPAIVALLKEVESKTDKLPKPNIEDSVDIQSIPLKLFVNQQIAPTLTKALAACYRAKPADPVEYVGKFLFSNCPVVSPEDEVKLQMIQPVQWLAQFLLRTHVGNPVYTDAPKTSAFVWSEMTKPKTIDYGISVLDSSFEQLAVYPTIFKKGMSLGGRKMVVKLQISSFTKFADIVWSAYEPITSEVFFTGSRHRNITAYLPANKGGGNGQSTYLSGDAEKAAVKQAMCLSLRANKDGKEELVLAESSFLRTRLRSVFDYCETDPEKQMTKAHLLDNLNNVEEQSKFMIANSGGDPTTWLQTVIASITSSPSARLSFDAFVAHLTKSTITATSGPLETPDVEGASVLHDSMSKVCDRLFEVKVYSNGVVHISDTSQGLSYVGTTSAALPTDDAVSMQGFLDTIVLAQ